jgi:hypothetical protein
LLVSPVVFSAFVVISAPRWEGARNRHATTASQYGCTRLIYRTVSWAVPVGYSATSADRELGACCIGAAQLCAPSQGR